MTETEFDRTDPKKAVDNGRDRAAPTGLACFAGQPAPAQLSEDWRAYQELPDSAKASVWEVLIPCLRTGAVTDEIEARADAFCRLYDVTDEALKATIRCTHLLISQVASFDLDAAQFRRDLEALSGSEARGVDALMSGFEAAKDVVREEIVAATLVDHGDVVTGLDWRIDTIQTSHRGANLAAPLTVLTFKYRNGEGTGRTTLHLTPQAVRETRNVLAQLERGLGIEDVTEQDVQDDAS